MCRCGPFPAAFLDDGTAGSVKGGLLRFEILGRLRIVADGTAFEPGTRKVETMLGILLIEADTIVPTTRLLGELWTGKQPKQPSASLYAYVSQLRRLLERTGSADASIVTRPSGYLLELGAHELDFRLFGEALGAGRRHLAGARYPAAAASFELALSYWRGRALDGLCGSRLVAGFAVQAGEARMECLELLAETYLHQHRHTELLHLLGPALADHPYRETLYKWQMLAYFHAFGTSAALGVYQRAADRLGDDLGLRPGAQLRSLRAALAETNRSTDINAHLTSAAA
jgi:DNA-binding SARP family transcriptional activator